MKKTQWNIAATLASTLCAAGVVVGSTAYAQCCTSVVASGQEYRLEHSIVNEPVQHTSYRKVCETQYVEEEVTTYETVWETQQREKRYTVAKQVPETTLQEKRYTVSRPVEETEYRDTSYNITRTVPETSEREERYVVSKQVFETQEREVVETRRVPVQETVLQDRVYTVNKPVTTCVTQTVDRGGFVDSVSVVPGQSYRKLAWQPGGTFIDPVTGASRGHLPGLFWTPVQSAPRYQVNRVYQPNYVTENMPVTTTVQEQRVEQVPVTRTTFRDEQVTRVEKVQVPRTVQEEVVRKVPVTTFKQIVERVEQTTPVKVRRMVSEEKVEQVPITTYKTVLEERVEPYEVKVAKLVPVKKVVRKPVTVEKWEPYTYTVDRKRVVVNRIPISTTVTSTITPTPVSSTAIAQPSERIVSVVDREVPATSVVSVAKPTESPKVVETSDEVTTPSTYERTQKTKTDAANEVPTSP